MNKLEKRIASLKDDMKKIIAYAERALDELSEVSDDDDLYIIERNISDIQRKADYAYDYVRETYDYLEED